MNCHCGVVLSGRQTKYCSVRCKNKALNATLQKYSAQHERGIARKKAAVVELGGACQVCGYSNNLAALVFHHRVPSEKSFMLNARTFANMAEKQLRDELAKCDLLCQNCHHEHHYPHLSSSHYWESDPDPLLTMQVLSH